MGSIKHFLEQSWLLIVASFFFGLLIAVTNASLAARIAWNATAKLNALASGLLPSLGPQEAETLSRQLVMGVDGHHVLQADDALVDALYHASKPQPGLLVALVQVDHLVEQISSLVQPLLLDRVDTGAQESGDH